MPNVGAYRGTMVLVSASLLCLVLGSVHAFSVFLEPIEDAFGASRTLVSLTYSFALVAITVAVLMGGKVFARLPPSRLIVLTCVIAACGSAMAAVAPSLPFLWLGYSLLFGGANGLGYGYGLQIAAQANPGHEGRCMGIVTACYALGATVSPFLFDMGLAFGGMRTALLGLAAALLLVMPVCAVLMRKSGAVFQVPSKLDETAPVPLRSLALLWVGYGAGVASGLMAIAHATGIAKLAGMTSSLWIAPMLIAIFNMVGSFGGGWLVDRTSPKKLLCGLPIISAFALVLLGASETGIVTLAGLACVGLVYGALIAAYPAVIAKMVGIGMSTSVYGKVFTAWGTAGLAAPWFAGYLFDRTGDYTVALISAAALSAVSALCGLRVLGRGGSSHPLLPRKCDGVAPNSRLNARANEMSDS